MNAEVGPEVVTRGRTIKVRWMLEQSGNETVYAELAVSHHGKAEYAGQLAKCYTARLGRTIIEQEDGYTVEKFLLHSRLSASIMREGTERYSAKSARQFMDRAIAIVEALRAEGNEVITAIFNPEEKE